MTPRRLTDWIAVFLRWVVGGVYIFAGAIKIPDPGKFAQAVANYRLLPHELVNFAAITLPWIEVLAGVLLVLGLWLRASAWLINTLTFVFILAIGSAVARGLDIECGCFGTVGGRQVGLIAIVQDIVLLACGAWILWQDARRSRVTTRSDATVPSANQGQSA